MGYVVKESAADTLLIAIEHIIKGDYYMDTSVSQKVVKKLATLPAKKSISVKPDYESLTPREQEVMAMLAEGMNAVQIADKLFISAKTA